MPEIIERQHFDLAHRLRTDDQLISRVREYTGRLGDLSLGRCKPEEYRKREETIMHGIWKDCGLNVSMLIPYFFPTYPKRQPMSMFDRPFNMMLLFLLPYHTWVLRGSRQIGKAQPYSEPIPTPGGWTTMGELKIGDSVFGSDGKPCKVTGVFEQGVKQTLDVQFSDNSRTTCDQDHLWKIRRNSSKNWKVESLRQIRERNGDSPESDLAVRIPLTDPVQYPEAQHVVSPYCLGAIIGDGGLSQNRVGFTTADPEILERVLRGHDVIAVPNGSSGMSYYLQAKVKWTKSALMTELERLGLHGKKSPEKFIPREYLQDSVENRWDLLRGLLDTDGSVYGKCLIEFSTSSPRLASDIAELAESLGGKTRLRVRDTGYKNKEGVMVKCLTAYRVFISQLPDNPFYLKRKAERFYQIKYKRTRTLKTITPGREERCRCIAVDSHDNTYLTRNFIVTHNSVSLAVRQRLHAHMFSGFTSMYAAPHSEPLSTYCRKFLDIERSFRFPGPVGDKFKQNLQYKEYANGAKVEMVRVQTSSVSIRGKSFSEILLDEAQLFDPGLETEILEVLSDSNIKSILYAGTSTNTESLLEARYQEGTQGVWHIQLDNGQTINCGDAEQVMKYIGPYYMQEPDTGHRIDPLRGFYVYENPAGFEKNIISIHIPQIINPDKANDALEWNGIYKTMIRDPKKLIQEKLGIPLAEANQEVSESDLRRICVLEDGPEARKAKCRERYYRMIVSGFDWGGSDYNPMTRTKISSTAHVILGVSPDDRVHILHCRRHAGKDYKTIMNEIVAAHRAHGGGGMASDFGGGQQYHMLLRTHPNIDPSRHVIFDYSAPETALCGPSKSSTLENMLMLNRTESITALYLAIVMDDPLILSPSWLEMEEYLRDFLNMNRVLLDKERGHKGRRFVYHRHPSKPDDIVHAMNMAYSMLRLSTQQLLIEDPAARMMIRNAVYGGQGSTVRSLNPFSKALSNYARNDVDHD